MLNERPRPRINPGVCQINKSKNEWRTKQNVRQVCGVEHRDENSM